MQHIKTLARSPVICALDPRLMNFSANVLLKSSEMLTVLVFALMDMSRSATRCHMAFILASEMMGTLDPSARCFVRAGCCRVIWNLTDQQAMC